MTLSDSTQRQGRVLIPRVSTDEVRFIESIAQDTELSFVRRRRARALLMVLSGTERRVIARMLDYSEPSISRLVRAAEFSGALTAVTVGPARAVARRRERPLGVRTYLGEHLGAARVVLVRSISDLLGNEASCELLGLFVTPNRCAAIFGRRRASDTLEPAALMTDGAEQMISLSSAQFAGRTEFCAAGPEEFADLLSRIEERHPEHALRLLFCGYRRSEIEVAGQSLKAASPSEYSTASSPSRRSQTSARTASACQ